MTQRRKGITAFSSTGLPTLPSQCGKRYTKLLFHLQNTQNTLWGQLTSQVLSIEHLFWSYKVSIPGQVVKKATKSDKVDLALDKFVIYCFQNIPVGTWLPWNSSPEPLYTYPLLLPDITGKAIFLLPLLLSSLIFGTKGPGWLPCLSCLLTGTAGVSHGDRAGIQITQHILPSHCSSLEAMAILASIPAQPPKTYVQRFPHFL